MKNLNYILSLSLILSTISGYGEEEDHEGEIALLEPSLFSETPTMQQEITPPTFAPRYKSPFLAVSLSTLCPGLGHAYMGDFQTAGALFGSTGAMITMGSLKVGNEEVQISNLVTLQNAWFYNIYASYRDVRAFNGDVGYSYKMPTDSFSDLAWAPFQWSVIKKPEVWGGFLGAFTVAAGLGYLFLSKDKETHFNLSPGIKFPLLAFPVGIGEESLFRGFLQSSLSETLTPWGGIAVSSLAFGAVHLANGALMEPDERRHYYSVGIPFITTTNSICIGFY